MCPRLGGHRLLIDAPGRPNGIAQSDESGDRWWTFACPGCAAGKGCHVWSGRRESNPRVPLGKLGGGCPDGFRSGSGWPLLIGWSWSGPWHRARLGTAPAHDWARLRAGEDPKICGWAAPGCAEDEVRSAGPWSSPPARRRRRESVRKVLTAVGVCPRVRLPGELTSSTLTTVLVLPLACSPKGAAMSHASASQVADIRPRRARHCDIELPSGAVGVEDGHLLGSAHSRPALRGWRELDDETWSEGLRGAHGLGFLQDAEENTLPRRPGPHGMRSRRPGPVLKHERASAVQRMADSGPVSRSGAASELPGIVLFPSRSDGFPSRSDGAKLRSALLPFLPVGA